MKRSRRMMILMPILVASAFPLTAQQPSRARRVPPDVFIFEVEQSDKSFLITPIVQVHYGAQEYRTIPSLNEPLPGQNPTNVDYERLEGVLEEGNRFSVFRGGNRLGEATSLGKKLERRHGCRDLGSPISYRATSEIPLLATNALSEIRGHRSTRRAGTSNEVRTLGSLAIQWLTNYGLDRNLIQKGKLGPVVATELRPNGGRALIGRFDVTSQLAIHQLFLIAEQDKSGYHLTLAKLEIQKDLEDGKDQTYRKYLDQLDIDNDGVDDVVTVDSYYEATVYIIWSYQETTGKWERRHQSYGSGC